MSAPLLLLFLFLSPYTHASNTQEAQLGHYFISDKTLPESADFAFDTAEPSRKYYPHNINNVYGKKHPTHWDGTKVIYVYTQDLPLFFSTWFLKIRSPFVLISIGNDHSIPGDIVTDTPSIKWSRSSGWYKIFNLIRIKKVDIHAVLANPYMLKWYTTNHDAFIDHPKLAPVPLGVAYRTLENKSKFGEKITTAAAQDQQLQDIVAKLKPTDKRHPQIYVDAHFSNTSSRHEAAGLDSRYTVYQKIKNNPAFVFQNTRMPRHNQWEIRGQYQFSLSLIGNGFDCFRTWESLILGNIVILQSSPLDHLFKNLPVVIIKDWSEITPENLKRWSKQYGDAFSNPKYREQLTSRYWQRLTRAHNTHSQ
jgi:hypothetical protein